MVNVMSEAYCGNDSVQDAIHKMFSGSIPERENEINELWSNFQINFQIHADKNSEGKYIFDAGLFRFIRFNHRVLRVFWIGAFSAISGYTAIIEDKNNKVEEFIKSRDEIFNNYSSELISLQSMQLSLEVMVNNFISNTEDIATADFSNFYNLIDCFENSAKDDFSDEKPFPAGVPEPGVFPDVGTDPINRGTAEIAVISTAWAFLHEVRHIIHQQDGTSYCPHNFTQKQAHTEELSCDEFATKFIIDKMNDYCNKSGDDALLVSRKRKLAIYCALFSLALLTKDNWDASDTHPSLKERMDKVNDLLKHPKDEALEAIVTCMFAALKNIWPLVPCIEF